MDKDQGISARFLAYIQGLDKTLGEKIGGPEPHLVSAKVSNAVGGALAGARERASSIDQERGISKQAGDVCTPLFASFPFIDPLILTFSTIPRLSTPKYVSFSQYLRFTDNYSVLFQSYQLPHRPEGLRFLHHHKQASRGSSRRGPSHCR